MSRMRRTSWLVGAALLVVGLGFLVDHIVVESGIARLQDLAVYLQAARDVRAGVNPYTYRPGFLPFTYPPIWAIAVIPLTALPLPVVQALYLVASLTVAVVVLRRLCRESPWPWLWFLVALFSAPVSRTIYQGQVNLFVMAIVLADYRWAASRFAGVGTGLATAVKLTPGIMILPMLVRRDWLSVVRAAVAFVVVTLIAHLVVGPASTHFWTELVVDPSRVGGVAFADNQSLLGTLARFTDLPTATLVARVLVAPVLVLTVVAAVRQHRNGSTLGEIAAAGLGGLLISPIAWTHHWVWMLVASAVLARQGRPRLAFLVLLPLLVDPIWLNDAVQSHVAYPLAPILLSLPTLSGLATLVLLAVGLRHLDHRQSGVGESDNGESRRAGLAHRCQRGAGRVETDDPADESLRVEKAALDQRQHRRIVDGRHPV